MRLKLSKSAILVALAGPLALPAGGCGDDDDDAPADVAGDYSINVTNRENGCEFENWQEGESTTAIPLAVTQQDSDVEGVIGGAVGVYMNVVLGSNTFSGSASGNSVTLTLIGRAMMEGNCAYTLNATLHGVLQDDVLTGTIEYTRATNDNPDCAPLEGCVSRQEFNGARPPS
jgi:hypothetical protein